MKTLPPRAGRPASSAVSSAQAYGDPMTAIGHRVTEAQDAREHADAFVTRMNLSERVIWLQHQGLSDTEILDGLLDPGDADLQVLTQRLARGIAEAWESGNISSPPLWLVQ